MIFVAKRKKCETSWLPQNGVPTVGNGQGATFIGLFARRRIGMRDVLLFAMGIFVLLAIVVGAAVSSMGLPPA
jgi:hypothetical protein